MNEIEKGPYKKNSIDSKNIFYISISVALIIIAFSFFYYNVIYKPQLDKSKIELQKIEQENTLKIKTKIETEITKIEAEYLECKKNAREIYELDWKAASERINNTTEGTLPVELSVRLEKRMQENVERCEREYKTKLETLKLKQN